MSLAKLRRAARDDPTGRRPDFPFRHSVDAPTVDDAPASHSVVVNGWVIVPRGAQVDGPFVDHGTWIRLDSYRRRDAEHRYRRRRVLGFQGIVRVPDEASDASWDLVLVVDGVTYRRPIPVRTDSVAHAKFVRDKQAKLERIEPLLRCPRPSLTSDDRRSCGGELDRVDGMLVCRRCNERYGIGDEQFDFLSTELRSVGGVESTDSISAFGYDPLAMSIVEEYSDGLVLDAGAGLKAQYHANVVNLEIVGYPTTDVLGIAEHLPFATGTFDGLLCLAVLEHVRDPFRCAAEIARVVKPGGRIYIAVPFLQPYHGYPHHYYNMTSQGLVQLFADDFKVDSSGVPAYGVPIWTLTWFLRSYLMGLPTPTAKRFQRMRVRDLLSEGDDYLHRDFVEQLDEETREELASVNYIMATKR